MFNFLLDVGNYQDRSEFLQDCQNSEVSQFLDTEALRFERKKSA